MTDLAGMRVAHRKEAEEYFLSVIEERLETLEGQEALKAYERYKHWLGWLVLIGAHPVALRGAEELLARAEERLEDALGSQEILDFFLAQGEMEAL